MFKSYSVKKISRKDCEFMVLKIHYAKRWTSVSYAFGLFYKNIMVGCITYGVPPSSTLRVGIAGNYFKNNILELNRLVLINNKKNEAS